MSNGLTYPTTYPLPELRLVAHPLVFVQDPSSPFAAHSYCPTPWPAGGVFLPRRMETIQGRDADAPEARVRVRRPVRLTPEVFDQLRGDLLDVDVDDTEALRRFHERWGLLGIGCPSNAPGAGLALLVFGPRQAFDGDAVEAARECLRAFQHLAIGDDPEALSAFWRQALTLEDPRIRFYFTWTLMPTGFAAEGGTFTLSETLCLAVRTWAQRPARRCSNTRCSALLLVSDRHRRFCSYACYNRTHARAHKLKTRVLRLLDRGATNAEIVTRCGVDPREVRKWLRAAEGARSQTTRTAKPPKKRRPARRRPTGRKGEG